MNYDYDIIVIGAGHAGSEAAISAAKMGSSVLLITIDLNKIAQMSCNPSIGGVAKGQIVKEIDALGGYSALVTDASTIQFRMLNRSKGPAMWSPRAQIDRMVFSLNWRHLLENTPNLHLWQDSVTSFIIESGECLGVKTELGATFYAKRTILTAGTFLGGEIFVGRESGVGGRVGEPAIFGLSEQLAEHGIEVGRMKTGTPSRVDIRSVDLTKLIEQEGDKPPERFSYLPIKSAVQTLEKQRSCYIGHTTPLSHELLKEGFQYSPMFEGKISGIGPRYCPSIEDKLNTFSHRDSHQLFLEPEGWFTNEYYLQGFSSSLPLDVQYRALRVIPGFENAVIYRPGYAVEYDYFPPTQLLHSLETRKINRLYFAGQVNGTTGYEEAAAQGMVAAINAHRSINGLGEFRLGRDEAYIGVLIDDLVTKGVDEPYRMFTSRAEYRILLRQDNGDERLTEIGHELGIASKERVAFTKAKYGKIEKSYHFLSEENLSPKIANPILEKAGTTPIKEGRKLRDLLTRPQIKIGDIVSHVPRETYSLLVDPKEFLVEMPYGPAANNPISDERFSLDGEILETVEIKVKYQGYIERERRVADKLTMLENLEIPKGFKYDDLNSISIEARQKLEQQQPRTIGEASRIPGVTPSDVAVLLIKFGR